MSDEYINSKELSSDFAKKSEKTLRIIAILASNRRKLWAIYGILSGRDNISFKVHLTNNSTKKLGQSP